MSDIPSTHTATVLTGETEDLKLVKLETVKTPTPKKGELLIKTVANALNPTDWKHVVFGWGKEGCIPGTDASGVVAAVGPEVVGFKVGDHVSTFTHGAYSEIPNGGSFQDYFISDPYLTINYGSGLGHEKSSSVSPAKVTTFEGAASITLAVLTVGLSYYHNFKLKFDKSEQTGKAVLIWGGATATGLIATQIAKKVFGLEVLVVASKKHEKLLTSLGADKLFDYHDSDVVQQIKSYAGEKLQYGYDTVSSTETIKQVYASLADSAPAVCENLLMLSEDLISNKKSNVKFTSSLAYLARGEDQLLGGFVVPSNEEMKADHEEYWDHIAQFVIDGTILHAPLTILPHGFNSVDEGFSLLRNDKVSGEKLIIRTADTTK